MYDPTKSPYHGQPPRNVKPIPVRTLGFPKIGMLALWWMLAFTGYIAGDRLAFFSVQADDWTLSDTGAITFGLASAVLLIVGIVLYLDPSKEAKQDRNVGITFIVLACSFIIGMGLGSTAPG